MYTKLTLRKWLLPLLLLFGYRNAGAQEPSAVLDGYINTAFSRNQGLKQQQFDLEKSMYALQEAKAMFLPQVSMQGSYTKSAGGRTIDVPVGDLVNPIYTELNKLTASNKFPMLNNESFLLNPDNFYDVKLHTTLPLVNAEIRYNRQIKQQMITVQQASVNVYKRALVRDIKTAYYQYFRQLQGIAVYNSALTLIRENIRENESMLRNGVRNGTALLRSQTELQKTNTALIQAQRNTENAKAYFNFLLNRPLQDSIIADPVEAGALLPEADTTAGIAGREELQQLHSLQNVYTLDYKREQADFIPQLNTFLDLGSQGFNFAVNNKTDYYFWGVNLQWNLFNGGRRKYRAAQANVNLQSNNAKLDETTQSLQLQLTQACNNYTAAKAAYQSAQAEVNFANKYYNDQLKAYRAGQLLYLELVDAQDQLTSARLQLAETRANVQIAMAELERDQATYPTHNTK